MNATPECRRYQGLKRSLRTMSRRYNEMFDTASESRFEAFADRMDRLREELHYSGKECRSSLRRTKRSR